MSPHNDPARDPHAGEDYEASEHDTEPTIIIDEDMIEGAVEEDGYTVRRKAPAAEIHDLDEVEPEVEDVLVVLPDSDVPGEPPRLESPMQAVLGSQRAEDVGLLSSHPAEQRAEPPELPDVEDMTVAALPDLEDVEDITAMIEDEAVELESPSEPIFVQTVTRNRSYGRWVAAAVFLVALGVGGVYGPGLYDQYFGGTEPRALAQRSDAPSGPDATDGPAPGVDPNVANDPNGAIVADPAGGMEPMNEEFESWLDSAVERNLTLESNGAGR